MKIGITETVKARMELQQVICVNDIDPVFCWYTHLMKIKRRNVLLIINANNRYTIATTDIEPGNWKYYSFYIWRAIYAAMDEMGYSQEAIEQYFKMAGKMYTAEIHNDKEIETIEQIELLAYAYSKKLEKNTTFQKGLMDHLNTYICQPDGFDSYGRPREFFKMDMEGLGIIAKRKAAKIIEFKKHLEHKR